MSLGPNGELKYPSYPPGSDGAGGYGGAGEFQCYDRHMLARLKRHAVAAGQPLWGLSGPHDAPRYGESPESSTFFRSPGGSWETAYGGFFLSWYAGELLAHGDRVLAAARRVFDGEPVELSAKVPLRGRARGGHRGLHGGYGPVAEMFARRGCTVIASGMDGSAAAAAVLAQVKAACAEHGARLAGERVARRGARRRRRPGAWGGLLADERIRPCHFIYQRMGADRSSRRTTGRCSCSWCAPWSVPRRRTRTTSPPPPATAAGSPCRPAAAPQKTPPRSRRRQCRRSWHAATRSCTYVQ